jgi:hypothetical protein
MPLAPVVIASIIGGGASLAGGALASRNRNTQSSAPVYDAQSQGLRDLVYGQISKRLGQGAPDLTGYKANGIADINHTFDLVGQSQANNLSARGLSTSPIGGIVDANRDIARGGEIARFSNTVPLLERSLQDQDLGLATSIFSSGRGYTGTSTSESGGGAAGGFTNLAQWLGYLQGKGAFGAGQSPLGARQTVPNFGFMPAGGPY